MSSGAHRFIAFIWLGLALSAQPAYGQAIMAQLNGVIRDETGAILPGVKVTVKNIATNLILSTVSGDSGLYQITNLPPGRYELTAELGGFAKFVQTGIELNVGQSASLDITMKIEALAERITVVAETPLIEPTKIEVSQVIESRRIENLPISGRNFVDFVLLSPKVAPGRSSLGGGAFAEVQVGSGAAAVTRISFGGQLDAFSFVAVDGADNNQVSTHLQRAAPSQEAAQEFRVINSSYSTEFGRSLGGIVNIITKSGSNELHGSLYEFFRNDALDAKNILAAPGFDELRQNQFGFTLGGPLRRDKTFFFSNYEGQRRDESIPWAKVILDNIAAINLAKRNLGLPEEDLGLMRTSDYDMFFIKADHQLTANNRLSFRYSFIDAENLKVQPVGRGSIAPTSTRDNFVRDQAFVFNGFSTISSRWVNESRFQFARRSFDFPAVGFNHPSLEVPNLLSIGRTIADFDFYRESRAQWSDNMSYLFDTHNLKFGLDINQVKDSASWVMWFPARVIFPSLPALLAPRPLAVAMFWSPPSVTTTLDPAFNLPPDWRNGSKTKLNHSYYGFFFQDQWRATSKLTLNYGLRYDFELLPENLVEGDFNNFQPRFGFAYAFNKKAVLRGGFGIFHDKYYVPQVFINDLIGDKLGTFPAPSASRRPVNLFILSVSGPGPATTAFFNLLNAGVYPPASAVRFTALSMFQVENRTPYSEQASMELEFELAPNWALKSSWLFVHGLKLPYVRGNVNLLPPLVTLPNGQPGFQGRRLDPRYELVAFATNSSSSVYHGGTISVEKRFSHNFTFNANYTFSKTIDLPTLTNLQDFPQNIFNIRAERALSKQHLGHRFVLSFLGEAPEVTPLRQFKLGSIVTIESGRPFNVFTGFDANGDGNPLSDRPGLLGRNTFEGPGFVTFDLRISREINFNERLKGEFIAEFFNLFNRVNINELNTVWGSASTTAPPIPEFGTPRTAFNPRQIQFAFKLSF